MTRELLVAVGSLKGSRQLVFAAAALGAVLLPVALLLDALGVLLRKGPGNRDTVTCEAGHPIPLRGHWMCACGFTSHRHILEACPNLACEEEAPSFVTCACGLSARVGAER